jgi:hypothetical protein
MLKFTFLLFIISVGLGICSVSNAAIKDLSGYVYSENAGWISLNCENTNSCDTVDYMVTKDDSGSLLGYGFSQNGQWIKFNPNFGGVTVKNDGSVSGWAYSEKREWVRIDYVKNISIDNSQKENTAVENIISEDYIANLSTMSLLNSLCNKFLSINWCNNIK